MATVIVSAPLPGPALGRLEFDGHEIILGDSPYGLGRDGLLQKLKEAPHAAALITLLSDPVDITVLDAAKDLAIVANYAVGVDNLDLRALEERKIPATNTPGVLTEATADLAMALLLDAFRNVSRGDRLVREGKWEGWSPTLLVGPRVTGATLGIVGFGRIGQAVARRARGFDMRVLYSQRTRLDPSVEAELGASYVSLDELIATSDVVSLHCPLTDSTRGLLDEARMRRMKRGAVLINCARGACVDEAALARLLAEGHLGCAGLDVYEREPRVHKALLSLPNVVLAPHLGSADLPTREKMAELCVESVQDVLAGREPRNRVVRGHAHQRQP
jgi:glyoxylate reductase